MAIVTTLYYNIIYYYAPLNCAAVCTFVLAHTVINNNNSIKILKNICLYELTKYINFTIYQFVCYNVIFFFPVNLFLK